MPYRIAGIGVHKRMLAVVITDVEVDGEYEFERRQLGTSPGALRRLAQWLVAEQVEEVVMESTAQYWRPVWEVLERDWTPIRKRRERAGPMTGALHLAQAQSNRGPSGRKKDFPDAANAGHGVCLHDTVTGRSSPEPALRPHNYSWAQLMRRVWAIDVLECPPMRRRDADSRRHPIARSHPQDPGLSGPAVPRASDCRRRAR